MNSTLEQAKVQLDETRSLDEKLDSLQQRIEEKELTVKEKAAELTIK